MKRRGGAATYDGQITRRDFIDGVLVGAGGLALGPLASGVARAQDNSCGDVLARDPRVARGGNVPSVMTIGHWLRDQRLTFASGGVTLAAGCDGREGKFPIIDDEEEVDVIIAGGGLAGLSAAFYLLRRRPGIKIRILEANASVGGNASYDDAAPLPVRASTCAAFTAIPVEDYLIELYRETGLDTTKHHIESPLDSYFFDEHTPGIRPGFRGWRVEPLSVFMTDGKPDFSDSPYDAKVMEDIGRCVRTITQIGRDPVGPDDPPEHGSPKFDDLSTMSFATYLTDVLHCDPRVIDFFNCNIVDCMGGTAHHVNALLAVCFLSFDYTRKFFAYPGGTAQIAIQLNEWLNKAAPGERPRARIDTDAMALSIESNPQSTQNKVGVIYHKDGKFRRARGKTMVLATPVQVARRLIDPLLNRERREAWSKFNHVPALNVNLALRSMRPLHELGLGFSAYWWGGKYWSNFLVADWTTERRNNSDRASVLSFYSHVTVPPEELPAERMKILTTPFAEYEQSLEEDLTRIFRGTSFNFKRDVSAIFIYRWGHSMILSGPNSLFGNTRDAQGRIMRERGPRRIACRPLGPIVFAGQYTEGSPTLESATGSGHRAALEILGRL